MTSKEAIEILQKARFVADLNSQSAEGAIDEMLATLKNDPHLLSAAELREAVLQRLQIDPPLLPGGIGLPHARTGSVTAMLLVIAIAKQPIAFGNARVRLLILIGVPKTAIAEYLELTSFLARHLRDQALVSRLLDATSLQEFVHEFVTN